MKISFNPKRHLEKQRLPLVWALPCQQCSMGNEEWVGVWPYDLSATRSGPSRAPSTSPCARLQLNRLPSFSHVQKENQLFCSCVARRVCELGEVERKLHRRWLLCFLNARQFTHLLGFLSLLHSSFKRGRTWAYGSLKYIIFNLMVNMINDIWKGTVLHLNHSIFIFVLTEWASQRNSTSNYY